MQSGPLGLDLVYSLEVPLLVWPEGKQLVFDGSMEHKVTGFLEPFHLGPCFPHHTGQFSDAPAGESGLATVRSDLVVFCLESALLGQKCGT